MEFRADNISRLRKATLYNVTPTADENQFVVTPAALDGGRTHIVLLQDSDLYPENLLDPVLHPTACTCEDYRFKKFEHHGWCKHRIAAATAEGAAYMQIFALMNPIQPVLTVSSQGSSQVMDNLDMAFDNEIGRVAIAADATSVEITLFPKGSTDGIPLLITDTKGGIKELGVALGVLFE